MYEVGGGVDAIQVRPVRSHVKRSHCLHRYLIDGCTHQEPLETRRGGRGQADTSEGTRHSQYMLHVFALLRTSKNINKRTLTHRNNIKMPCQMHFLECALSKFLIVLNNKDTFFTFLYTGIGHGFLVGVLFTFLFTSSRYVRRLLRGVTAIHSAQDFDVTRWPRFNFAAPRKKKKQKKNRRQLHARPISRTATPR